jgi:hypothetical protein
MSKKTKNSRKDFKKGVKLQMVNRGGKDNKLSIGRLPIPPRAYTRLHFWSPKTINNAAAIYANVRFIPTYAYDVDPALGSTAMPFFAELGTLYRYYRVTSSKISVHFAQVSADATATNTCVCPVNFDPGANTAASANYFSNPLSKKGILGYSTGNSTCVVSNSMKTDTFAGVKWEGVIDNYCGTTTGSLVPSNNWYWFVGTYTSPAMTNGCIAFIDLSVDICFFEETSPST